MIFDLDGVLVDSEAAWDEARREVAAEFGIEWPADAQQRTMGMSSNEWSRFMRDEIGVPMELERINAEVVRRMVELYREELPLLPGARKAVRTMAASWRLGLASSSNRPIIDLVLELAGVSGDFEVTVSSEEVGRGKPAPDVYVEAARRLGVEPRACAAIEDSSNGIRAAHAAGLRVIAVPNAEFPPEADALALADASIDSLARLTPGLVAGP